MLSTIKSHKLISALSGISLIFVLSALAWSYFSLRGIASPLVLHFNDNSGVTQTGVLGSIIGIGILGILMVLINTMIAFELDSRDQFLGRLMAGMTLVFAILLFIAASAIIGVN